jgi:tetratricopeptide (TPR) repeat protein
VDALRALGSIALDQKSPGEAAECIFQLDSLGAPSPELSYNLGLLFQSAGDHDGAAECYRAALRHQPASSRALINLGHALKATGKEDEARQAWSQAMAADPDLAGSYFQ